MKANLPVREKDILAFWEKNEIYSRLLEKNRSKEKFVLHDGPPYANGDIHIGHALNKILKDIIVKYRSVNNRYTLYIPGWDCHGLPIEYQLFKELGKDKKQIDRVSFRKKAHDFALRFVEQQKKDFLRLGAWGQWNDPYLTLNPAYETGILHVLEELVKLGYVYRRKKPIYWCMHCETALADAEVEYADISSPSIYVKFRIISLPAALSGSGIDAAKTSVLIWTTTPWTLPANVAIAFNPDEEYVLLNYRQDGSDDYIIVAHKLLEKVVKEAGLQETRVTGKFKGSDFEGITCRNPVVERESRGVTAGFVSMEDGTGIVHIAPGHGAEDYSVGLKYNLPVLSPVNGYGRFTDEVPLYAGKKVFEADKLIVEKLKAENTLVYKTEIMHSYPHCWRCKKPIIFRATEQWFLDIEHNGLRGKLIESITKVQWIPAYGEIRIGDMLKQRPDWCLSRQRYWGVPIPAIYCAGCKTEKLDPGVISRFGGFVKTEGTDCWFTRPVEDFLPPGFKCEKCGSTKFEKEEDILDVWFDSGASYQAVLANNPGLSYPADMYLEGSDQHRGWFQTSLIPSVAINGIPPYRKVLTHGFVVDGEGKKMSKSTGNTVSPQDIVKLYGAEILRLWTASSDYSEDVRVSKEIIDRLIETYRKIRNTIRFMLANLYDFDPSRDRVEYENLWETDRYILNQLQELIKQAAAGYESYQFYSVISRLNSFCVVDLSNFYLDILKDRLYTFKAASVDRRSAQTALHEILSTFLKLLAPISSFTAEEAWQFLLKQENRGLTSVFLESFPEVNEKYVSPGLKEDWEKLISLRNSVNASIELERKKGVIGSSLESRIILTANTDELYKLLSKHHSGELRDRLETIFIVSQVELKLDTNLKEPGTAVLHAEGTKCPRCWNWAEGKEEGGLCKRCESALK